MIKCTPEKSPDITAMVRRIGAFPGFQGKEVCPFCGYEHVHLVAVKVLRENDEITVSTDVQIKKAVNNMRGSSITIEYLGECGHKWTVNRQFDKGVTFVCCTLLGKDEGDKGGLWRD